MLFYNIFLLVIILLYSYLFKNSFENTILFSNGLNLVLVTGLLIFIKIFLKNFFHSKYHSLIDNIYIFILVLYFIYLQYYFLAVITTVAHCVSITLPGVNYSKEETNSTIIKDSVGAHSKDSMIIQGDLKISTPQNDAVDTMTHTAAGVSIFALGTAVVAAMPTPATKVAALGVNAVTAVLVVRGSSALDSMSKIVDSSTPTIVEAMRAPQSGMYKESSGSFTNSGPNSPSESSILDKVIDYVKDYTNLNSEINLLTAFSRCVELLLFMVIILTIYVVMCLLFRDPVVKKLTQYLEKFGKIGFIILKYIEFLSTVNRYYLVLALIFNIAILFVLITWMIKLGQLNLYISK